MSASPEPWRGVFTVFRKEFFENLRDEVSAGMAAGKPLAELKESIRLERYKDWANYERLRAYNVEAAYRNLLIYR